MAEKEKNAVAEVFTGLEIPVELVEASGGHVVEMGTKVRSTYLEKLKCTENRRERIAFLTNKPIVVKFHYDTTKEASLGYIQCFGGDCCSMFGPAKVRYLFPIIQYSADPKGDCSPDCSYEVKVLAADSRLYEQIDSFNDELSDEGGPGIVGNDWKVTCTSSEYNTLNLVPVKRLLWRGRDDIRKDIAEQKEMIFKNTVLAVAKPMDAQTFKRLKAELSKKAVKMAEEVQEKDPAEYLEDDELS